MAQVPLHCHHGKVLQDSSQVVVRALLADPPTHESLHSQEQHAHCRWCVTQGGW
jgi:hypothetical protein